MPLTAQIRSRPSERPLSSSAREIRALLARMLRSK
jgi:hypothetical protein